MAVKYTTWEEDERTGERTKHLALAYGGKKYIFECAQETWVVAWCSWSQKRPF